MTATTEIHTARPGLERGWTLAEHGEHLESPRLFPLRSFPCRIGRQSTANIRLLHPTVSGLHAEIGRAGQQLHVRDLGSRNGTFVNEMPIRAETLLKPGDTLRVGPLHLVVPGRKEAPPKPHIKLPAETASEAPSDDDITAWLSEDAPSGLAAPPGDTTIISNKPATTAEAAVRTAPLAPAPSVAAGPASDRRKYQSLADEAADIIRRYHDQKTGRTG